MGGGAERKVNVDGVELYMEREELDRYLGGEEGEREAKERVAFEKRRLAQGCKEWCECMECDPGPQVLKNALFIKEIQMRLIAGYCGKDYILDTDWTEMLLGEFGPKDDFDESNNEWEDEWESVVKKEAKKWKSDVGADFIG